MVSETIKAWKRRSKWTQVIDGVTWNLRQLTASEVNESLALGDQLQSMLFIFASVVLDENGNQVVSRNPQESATDYTQRAINEEFGDCPIDIIREVTDAVSLRLSSPKVDAVKKN